MFVSLDSLAERRRELDAAEAEWLHDVAVYDRSGQWQADGYQNSGVALRDACRMNVGVARGNIELSRKLEQLPEVAAARALTPRDLLGVVRVATDAIDGDGGAAQDDEQHARRRLHMSKTFDGMTVADGLYDPEAGAIHHTAITAEMQRDLRRSDPRTPAQRRADALTNILRRSLDTGELGTAHAVSPHLSYVIDLARMPGATPELVEWARAERRQYGRLSAATLERIACDCDVSRVVMHGLSEVLDVGRATRTPSIAQWKALVARDRHCQAPGCDAPPEQCEAHHLWHWEHGGPTNLDNMLLYCRHHHREHHRHDARARAG